MGAAQSNPCLMRQSSIASRKHDKKPSSISTNSFSAQNSDMMAAADVCAKSNVILMEDSKRDKARSRVSVPSLFAVVNGKSGRDTVLSDRQKTMIKDTWRMAIAAGKLKPGIMIFQNIFRRCPELKCLFHLEHVENLVDLPKEDRFLRHAKVFSDVIDLAVRNIDELNVQIAPALITLGRRHYYKHNVGFRSDYLAVFAQAMMDFVFETLHIGDDKEVVDGWWIITVYLVKKLQHGYEMEAMSAQSKCKRNTSGPKHFFRFF